MLGRKPTRIELKLDDLEEVEEKKLERWKSQAGTAETSTREASGAVSPVLTPKTKKELI